MAAPGLDDRHAAHELREAFLELLAIVIAGGALDLPADLVGAAVDVLPLAAAFDDQCLVLVDGDPLGLAKVLKLHVLEFDAQVLGDELAAGDDGRCRPSAPCADRQSPAP